MKMHLTLAVLVLGFSGKALADTPPAPPPSPNGPAHVECTNIYDRTTRVLSGKILVIDRDTYDEDDTPLYPTSWIQRPAASCVY